MMLNEIVVRTVLDGAGQSVALEGIAKQTQRLLRLERALAKHKAEKRRLDTRHKILLGGLVLKAQLDGLPFSVLLGGLFSLESQLCAEPHLLDVFRAKGEAVFLGFRPVLSGALVLERASALKPSKPGTQRNKQIAPAVSFPVTGPFSSSSLALTAPTDCSAEARLAAFKKTARHKIQLGGLVLKANLGTLSKAQLLGALVTLADTVIRCPAVIEDYRIAGELALVAAPHVISTAPPRLPLSPLSSCPPTLPLCDGQDM